MEGKSEKIEKRLSNGDIEISWTNSNNTAIVPLSSLIEFHESELRMNSGALKRWPLRILIELMTLELMHKHCDADLSIYPI